jgi:hypothetical protein
VPARQKDCAGAPDDAAPPIFIGGAQIANVSPNAFSIRGSRPSRNHSRRQKTMRPLSSYTLAACLAAMLAAPARPAVPAAPKPRGLMAMMEKALTGHPVIAVGEWAFQVREKSSDEAAFAATKDELGRLQVISAAASTDDMPLIPFAVRGAWVIAPQFRQDLRTDFTGVTAASIRSQSELLTRALLTLPPEQMAEAGDGIAIADIPKESRAFLMAALRPPFRIMAPRKVEFTFPDGQKHEVSDRDTNARGFEPPS